jgi:vacuolar protein-sorting-associated protein 4
VAVKIEDCKRRIAELAAAIPPPAPAPAAPSPAQSSRNPEKQSEESAKQSEESAMRSRLQSAILVEKPNVHWSDVAGLAEAKRQLIQTLILPFKIPQFFTGSRAPWRGILLYGPPGTGKSFLAKACATEADGSTFLSVTTSDLISKWMGESEKLIRALFDTARDAGKAVVFIDEIDSILRARSGEEGDAPRRVKTEFLIQMDGVGKSLDGVLILGATNAPWDLDPAARRRFEKRIYIPLPDREARETLVSLKTRGIGCAISDADVAQIAEWTEGYSGADIAILCRDAAIAPLNRIQKAQWFVEDDRGLWPCGEDTVGAMKITLLEMNEEQLKKLKIADVRMADFQEAMTKIRPSVSWRDLAKYEHWTREFGQEGS